MTEIKIEYDRGTMVIHLEEFLSCRSISKVKKLLKIIQQSHTPEAADQMQQFIEDKVGDLDVLMRVSARRYELLQEKVQGLKYAIEAQKSQRDRNTKDSPFYKYYNDILKVSRENLRDAKKLLNIAKREFDNHAKDKAFLEKLLTGIRF